MNDRELLELIAAQVGGLTNQVGNLTNQVDNLTNQVGNLTNDVAELKKGQLRIEVTLENDIKPDIKALYDGYKQLAESQEEMKADIKEIKSRQESQEVEIRVIKGGRNKKIK